MARAESYALSEQEYTEYLALRAAVARLHGIYGDIAGYVMHHDDQWGERAEHLSVPVDYYDLQDWRDMIGAALPQAAPNPSAARS